MDREKLIAKLGLAKDATDEQILAVLDVLKANEASTAQAKKDLEVANAKIKTVEAELALAHGANPSLDKFVPRSDYDAVVAREKSMKTEKEEAEKAAHEKAVNEAVDEACKEGKVTPATKQFYIDSCSTKEGLEKFKAFAKDQPKICEPSNLETDPKRPDDKSNGGITSEELLIAQRCGITKEAFIAARSA